MSLEHWQQLPGGVTGWSAEFVFAHAAARSVAIPLTSGGVMVWNAGREVPPDARQELADQGGVKFILCPNFFHHLGIRAWRETLGQVPVVAADQARRRLAKKIPLRDEEVEPLLRLEPHLPDDVRFLTPPGVRTGETWLQCDSGSERCWIVGDAFFHIPNPPWNAMGLILRALGSAPGFRLSHAFKHHALASRPDYRGWLLDRLADGGPTILIPAHGDPLAGPRLAADIRRLVEKRL